MPSEITDNNRGLALQVPPRFRRGRIRDEASSVREASKLLSYMGEAVGRAGLAGARILDIGCGVKFTQALLTNATPIARYVGVDVFAELIAFLNQEVSDPRFSFVRLDAHNEMYHPKGRPLDAETTLPLGEERFDIVCGFSLFTHLAPHDYVSMLRLMRRYVTDDGRLFFSLFVNERTAGGMGLIDKLGNRGAVQAFVDFTPSKPLLHAVYSREHAFELMEGTGWKPLELRDPIAHLHHHFICAPI